MGTCYFSEYKPFKMERSRCLDFTQFNYGRRELWYERENFYDVSSVGGERLYDTRIIRYVIYKFVIIRYFDEMLYRIRNY